jgi:hypothetical protein
MNFLSRFQKMLAGSSAVIGSRKTAICFELRYFNLTTHKISLKFKSVTVRFNKNDWAFAAFMTAISDQCRISLVETQSKRQRGAADRTRERRARSFCCQAFD